MPGQTGHNTQPHAQFPGYGCMDDLTTESSFNSQATCVIMSLIYFFDMLSLGVCTTRHWQTSGRLVQELKVCTAPRYTDYGLVRQSTSCSAHPQYYCGLLVND